MAIHTYKLAISFLIVGLAALQIECCRLSQASLEKRRYQTALKALRRRQRLCSEQNDVSALFIGGANKKMKTNCIERIQLHREETRFQMPIEESANVDGATLPMEADAKPSSLVDAFVSNQSNRDGSLRLDTIGTIAFSDLATASIASSSNVSPKGNLAYCGRSLYNGLPIYFIVKHRNYAGPEDKIIHKPIFLNEDDVALYVKGIDPRLQIKHCPCGCWKMLGDKHHFVASENWTKITRGR